MDADALFPRFVDIEASGLASESYPISLAWSRCNGTISRFLICPAPTWTHWDPAAEAVHGIERARLQRNGWEPAYVVERLCEDLVEGELVSDAPVFDAAWLERLFAVVERPVPFTLVDVEDLLIERMRQPGEMDYEVVLRLDAIRLDLRARLAGRHDAGYDVGYLLQLWRAAHGAQVKMSHGRGPLPKTSPTGTFERIKLPEA